MDVVYIGIAVVFFALTRGLMKICENLDEQKTGERP